MAEVEDGEIMKLTPRDYQIEDIAQALAGHEGKALIGNGMGTGKTLTAVEVGLRSGAERILIIAPLNTFDTWTRTITSQNEHTKVHVHPAGGRTSKQAQAWWERVATQEPGWYVIGWEAFRGMPSPEIRKQYKAAVAQHKALGIALPEKGINTFWGVYGTWDLVIADEVHRAANRKSVTSKTLYTLDAQRKLAMSGTPAGNKVEGYWSVLHWLWPKEFPYFWRWASKFCDMELDEYVGKKVVGEKEPGIIARNIPTYIRRTLEEVAGDLPEVITRTVRVPLKTGAQGKAYRELEQAAFTWLEGQPLETPLPIVQSMRLRQVALGVPTIIEEEVQDREWMNPEGVIDKRGLPDGMQTGTAATLGWRVVVTGTHTEQRVTFDADAKSNKIDALKDILSDLPPDEPVMIYTHSAQFVRAVVHQLNKLGIGSAVAWTGQTSHKGRRRIMEDFGKPVKPGGPKYPRFIVAGIAAIGEGVDGLQHRCSHEIWLSQHDNNLLNAQAEARLHRSGQTKPVQRWYIQTKATVDIQVYKRLEGNAHDMAAAYRKDNPK